MLVVSSSGSSSLLEGYAAFAELTRGDAETLELKDSVDLDVGRDGSLTAEEKDKVHAAAAKLGLRKDILDHPTRLYELLQCSSAKSKTLHNTGKCTTLSFGDSQTVGECKVWPCIHHWSASDMSLLTRNITSFLFKQAHGPTYAGASTSYSVVLRKTKDLDIQGKPHEFCASSKGMSFFQLLFESLLVHFRLCDIKNHCDFRGIYVKTSGIVRLCGLEEDFLEETQDHNEGSDQGSINLPSPSAHFRR
jgi:hypothetical protein